MILTETHLENCNGEFHFSFYIGLRINQSTFFMGESGITLFIEYLKTLSDPSGSELYSITYIVLNYIITEFTIY